MIAVLLDTNVILDFAEERTGFVEAANEIFSLIDQRKIEGYVSASAITDIYYFLEKRFRDQPGVSLSLLKQLVRILRIVSVNAKTIEMAVDSNMPDFEDAVQTMAAIAAGIDTVVTRDKSGFLDSGLNVYTPEQFLKTITPTV